MGKMMGQMENDIDLPRSIHECREAIAVALAEHEQISADLDAAKMQHERGDDVDFEWYRKATSARAHISRRVAALRKLVNELNADAKAEEIRLKRLAEAEAAAEINERRRQKAEVAAMNINRSNTEQRLKLCALMKHLNENHPDIAQEAIDLFEGIEADLLKGGAQ